jgi:hypothetical protein
VRTAAGSTAAGGRGRRARRRAKRKPLVSTDETQLGDVTPRHDRMTNGPEMNGPGGAPGSVPQHWKKVEKPAPDSGEPPFDDSVDGIDR